MSDGTLDHRSGRAFFLIRSVPLPQSSSPTPEFAMIKRRSHYKVHRSHHRMREVGLRVAASFRWISQKDAKRSNGAEWDKFEFH